MSLNKKPLVIEGEYTVITENTKHQNNYLTNFIIALCIAVFVVQLYFDPAISSVLLFHNELSLTWLSEPWRNVTPAFMHGSVIHLLMNLLVWHQLAKELEIAYGYKLLFLLLIITAIISNVAQYIDSGPNFLGLSGVVFGLIGYIWMHCKLYINSKVVLGGSVMTLAVIWIIGGYLNLIPFFNMANSAHLFGLLSGMMIAFVKSKLDS